MGSLERQLPLVHVHSNLSLPFGIAATSSVDKIIDAAVQSGHQSIGISDRNTFFNLFPVWHQVGETDQKLKYDPVVELKVQENEHESVECLLIPRTLSALEDVFRLVSQANASNGAIKPFEVPLKPDITVALSGDLSIKFVRDLLDSGAQNVNLAVNYPQKPHTILENIRSNPNYRSLITHEVRLIKPGDQQIIDHYQLMDPKHHWIGPTKNLPVLPTPAKLISLYQYDPELLGKSIEILNGIHVDIYHPPDIRASIVPLGVNPDDFLRDLVYDTLRKKGKDPQKDTRINQELEVIKICGVTNFTLIFYEIACFCRDFHIPITVSGSANNSQVYRELNITHVNARDKYFPVFLYPGRQGKPDINIQVASSNDAEKIRNFVKTRYGEKEVVGISEIEHLRKKGITASHDPGQSYLKDTEAQDLADAELVTGFSRHTSAMTFDLNAVLPRQPSGELQITQNDLDFPEFDLIKIDLLSNTGMWVIESVIKQLQEAGVNVKFRTDDRSTLERIFKADVPGVHLLDTDRVRHLLQVYSSLHIYERKSIKTLGQILALSSVGDDLQTIFMNGAKNQPLWLNICQPIAEILRPTHGTIICRDQLIALANIAGFSDDEAKILTDIAGNFNIGDERITLLRKFHQGLISFGQINHIERMEELANRILYQAQSIPPSAYELGYAENMAIISYWETYLYDRYPIYYLTTLLSISSSAYPPAVQRIIDAASKRNISFSFPPFKTLINQSQTRIVNGKIEVGANMFHNADQDIFKFAYNQFLVMLLNLDSISSEKLKKFQLENFGICFVKK
jgi:DNA polymerase III alpha subunit